MGLKLWHPAVVPIVRVTSEISHSVVLGLQAQREQRSDSANRNHSTSLARTISYLAGVERFSLLMPPGLLHPPSFASVLLPPSAPPSHFIFHSPLFFCFPIRLASNSTSPFLSSPAFHLPPSLFHFSLMHFFSVIGSALLKCDRPTQEKFRADV